MWDQTTGMDFNPLSKSDDRMIAEFFTDAVQNNFRSEQEGRAVFDEVEKVRIIIPGDKRTEVVERVKDEHRHRWPQLYAQFKAGLEQAPDGTPIEEWPPINKAWAANLKALNIRTVEQLAEVGETSLSQIGLGARDMQNKAIQWLKTVRDGQPLAEALAARARAEEIAATQAQQIADLTKIVQDMQNKAPPHAE